MTEGSGEVTQGLIPVRDPGREKPEEGIALCLSGGGYRAMLFHLGRLIRLNETGHLKEIARVSSVSGGSITAGVLGLAWKHLDFGIGGIASNLDELVVKPVRKLGWEDDRQPGDHLGPVAPLAHRLGHARELLRRVPLRREDGAGPFRRLERRGSRFVFNATNVQTGKLERKVRTGSYWGIRSDVANYELVDPLPVSG